MTTVSPLVTRSITGKPASGGFACGAAFLVAAPADLERVPAGAVVVATEARSAYASALNGASALVTTGGLLTNLATVARELGTHCVVLPRDAVRAIGAGDDVTVDGTAGVVTIR